MNNILKILNYLGKNPEKEFTMHELSKILKIPYATFYRKILNIQDMLIIKVVGNSKVIRLDRENKIIQSYLTISSEEEKKEFLKNRPLIRIIGDELDTDDVVLIFGSYALGKESEKSDMDIMIINKSGKRTISFSKYETIHDIEINPLFFKEKEFKTMIKETNENVGKQVLKNHIVLNNPKRFWEVVLDAIR